MKPDDNAAPELLPGLPETPQARHHYTTDRQLARLDSIGNEDPDIGFMHRLLTLCTLPRTNPGDRLQYKRQNGPYKLFMIAGGDNKLPFGNIPRLLLAWVCTEAVRTRNPKLVLGNSLSAFMHQIGITSNSGGSRGDRTRLKNQIDRLFSCHIDLIYETEEQKSDLAGGKITPTKQLWWDYHNPDQIDLFKSWVRLDDGLFNEILAHPVPIDMQILKAIRRSTLGLDIYLWLSYKTYSLYTKSAKPKTLLWPLLYRQFAANPSLSADQNVVNAFRVKFLREMTKIQISWPALDYELPRGGILIKPCMPSIEPATLGSLKLPV